MKFSLSARAIKDYGSLPSAIQKSFNKQITFLLHDLRYPSLQAKKYDETRSIWQARVDRNYRFYFQINKDVYQIISIISHPK
jgi:mRNA-degrading endonuclease RelE of RelBE toxin-antitoxin system